MSTLSRKQVSPYERQNDRFGYAVYSVVAMASLAQQGMVDLARRALGCQRAMVPAHVTVKGAFCEIPGLDEVMKRVKEAAAVTPPFRVRFSGRPNRVTSADGRVGASQGVERTPELLELHEQLYHALAPVTVNAYGDEAGEAYHPHLTVYDEPLPELEYRTTDILNTMQLGDGFECSSVFLMGHIGRPYRGRWTAVREFVLGGK
jgi:2'-5' RNA ligase